MLRYYAPRPAAAAVGAMRRLCTSAPKLTLEQAITSSHLVLDILKSPEVTQHLHSVRSADKLAKWQSANTALIQSTLRVLPQLGYPADVSGLQEYTAAFATHARAESSDARETLQGGNAQPPPPTPPLPPLPHPPPHPPLPPSPLAPPAPYRSPPHPTPRPPAPYRSLPRLPPPQV